MAWNYYVIAPNADIFIDILIVRIFYKIVIHFEDFLSLAIICLPCSYDIPQPNLFNHLCLE